jgi:hypothetical protein
MTGSRKPFLIRMLALLLGFVATTSGVMIAVTLVASRGVYHINGDEVTRAEFLARAVPWLALAGFAAGSVAWAFWTQRPWARPLFVVLWTAAIASLDYRFWHDPAIDADEIFVTVFSLMMLLPVIWYFYLKRSVTTYYRVLSQDRPVRRAA